MSMSERRTIPNDMVMLQDFHHICLLVRDVEKAAQNFAKAFSIGPFTATPYETPTSKGMVHGKPQGYKLKFANAKIGPITLELVEPVEGNSVLTEFLKERGEGLHHLAYRCPPPIDEELAKWKKLWTSTRSKLTRTSPTTRVTDGPTWTRRNSSAVSSRSCASHPSR